MSQRGFNPDDPYESNQDAYGVVRDLNPNKPVNGLLLVNHNGRESVMPKTVVRVSFHLDAKKEFGEVVR